MKFLRKKLNINSMGFAEMRELLDLVKFMQFKIKKNNKQQRCGNHLKYGCPMLTNALYHITPKGKNKQPLCN